MPLLGVARMRSLPSDTLGPSYGQWGAYTGWRVITLPLQRRHHRTQAVSHSVSGAQSEDPAWAPAPTHPPSTPRAPLHLALCCMWGSMEVTGHREDPWQEQVADERC